MEQVRKRTPHKRGTEAAMPTRSSGTAQELAALAHTTARACGGEALSWWRDPYDPGRLWLDAIVKLPNGHLMTVLLRASVPATPSPEDDPAS